MLELKAPVFAHLPLLLNEKGQKLSKRFGDVSVQAYKDQGYLPEAMINGLALLGWNPPHRQEEAESVKNGLSKHEVLTMEDLLKMVR
jgi:glutamyl/glutaminyl-tRNA synthetase